jgi:N-acetylglucosaminyldiphosphoundecaprenol N-acetyl-beta-D-mannosaminyltransferase
VARLKERFPRLNVVGIAAPMIDIGGPLEERRTVAEAKPDLVLVALGSPKQEIFCHETAEVLKPAILVGVGAGIDFIAGLAKRAPAWMSRAGVEWLYRLAHEPRRLAGRYLLRDPQFLTILLRQWMRRPSARIGSAG